MEPSQNILPKSYKACLTEIKERILSSQIKAATTVNRELVNLYWEMGATVYQKQKSEGIADYCA